MAMSRSFGGRVLTSRPPIDRRPDEIDSSPAIIRSVVDFPHPDGPDQHDELAIAHVEVETVDGHESGIRVDLADTFQRDSGHGYRPLSSTRRGGHRLPAVREIFA